MSGRQKDGCDVDGWVSQSTGGCELDMQVRGRQTSLSRIDRYRSETDECETVRSIFCEVDRRTGVR